MTPMPYKDPERRAEAAHKSMQRKRERERQGKPARAVGRPASPDTVRSVPYQRERPLDETSAWLFAERVPSNSVFEPEGFGKRYYRAVLRPAVASLGIDALRELPIFVSDDEPADDIDRLIRLYAEMGRRGRVLARKYDCAASPFVVFLDEIAELDDELGEGLERYLAGLEGSGFGSALKLELEFLDELELSGRG
jgi:hypothetical protein